MAAAVSSPSLSSLHLATLYQPPSPSSALKSCPSISFTPSNGSCLVCMATKKVSAKTSSGKKSWLPGMKGGGKLGDYGFDPLGLGKDPAALKWYRENGRWAIAVVVGIFVGQAWSGVPWFKAGGAAPGAVLPFSFDTLLGTQLLLMGWVESKRWVEIFDLGTQSLEWATPWSCTAENLSNSTGFQGYPGGEFFDSLDLAGEVKSGKYVPDYAKLERLRLAEIKHARYTSANGGDPELLHMHQEKLITAMVHTHREETPCTGDKGCPHIGRSFFISFKVFL